MGWGEWGGCIECDRNSKGLRKERVPKTRKKLNINLIASAIARGLSHFLTLQKMTTTECLLLSGMRAWCQI